MSNDKLTDLVLVIDRSGSMAAIKDDMEGGLGSLMTEQHGLPGRCRVTLHRFDSRFDTPFEAKPSGDVRPEDLVIEPRGSTALFDAVVRALSATEARIMGEPEQSRPDLVAFVIITDGQENASREVRSVADVNAAIKRASDKFGWSFAFLAADAAGFAQGAAMARGVSTATASSYEPSRAGASEVGSRVSRGLTSYRAGKKFDVGE